MQCIREKIYSRNNMKSIVNLECHLEKFEKKNCAYATDLVLTLTRLPSLPKKLEMV